MANSEIVWKATKAQEEKSRLFRFMKKHDFRNYQELYKKSIEDVAWFWEAFVQDIDLKWDKPYKKVLDVSKSWKWAKWFPRGKVNWVYNAVDRHTDGIAIVWEGEEGQTRQLTYAELAAQVNRLANGLKSLGIKKGDCIGVFMPMTPECVITTLAVSKIGAIFTPIFSGYGAHAIATRLNDCEAKVLFTSDSFYRRGNRVPMKETADEAIALAPSVKHCIVHKRSQVKTAWNKTRDIDWNQLLQNQSTECPHEVTDASDPYMIIYTSGTTGKPKGTVHVHAGFPLKATMDLAYHFDLQETDRLFWFSDMGWMMGPWEVSGALLLGATVFLYDGVPDFPDVDRLWKMVERHGITILGLSPTVIRALMKYSIEEVKKYKLDSLRVLGSSGEPWNPESWNWFFENVGKRACPIVNYSGGTEIGGGILACSMMQTLKPCAFAGPTLGMDADVVNEKGASVRGEVGELVIRKPWVGMTQGFWNDKKRYEQTYWSRIPETWVHGDWARIDEDGFWFIEGRSDDTIKVAGKRIGPAEVESALVSHPSILEAAAVGVPDELKGESIVAFVILKPKANFIEKEVIAHATKILGKAVAPQVIKVVRELPKTRNGKIMRRVIRAKYLGLSDLGDLSGLESQSSLLEIQDTH